MDGIRAVAGAVLGTLLGVAPALASPWPPPHGNPGQSAPKLDVYDRKADREEGRFWQQKYEGAPAPLPPAVHFPGLPAPTWLRPPGSAPKTGPMTLDDLRLVDDGKGGFRGRRPGYRFAITSDGTIQFTDRPAIEASPALMLGMVGMVASFDLTDVVMRLHGDDPYSYDKARVIELTREMRSKMTDVDRAARLREAVRVLPQQLSALWGRGDLAPPARRALLFSLWDELLETTTTPEGRAAAEARAAIVGFVRARLGAGTAEAFTPSELVQLNGRRRSRAVFAPYGPAPATR